MTSRYATRQIEIALYAVACLGAFLLTLWPAPVPLPVVGEFPILPLVLGSAGLAYLLVTFLQNRDVVASNPGLPSISSLTELFLLGGLLALPPIAIDLAYGFPEDMNLPLPAAALFYPAIALVAETAFHLLPIALLAAILPQRATPIVPLAAAILVEPLYQSLTSPNSGILSGLIFGNVLLVSITQIWVFRRYGFAAMLGLRLSFYLFWHIAWATARVPLLFN